VISGGTGTAALGYLGGRPAAGKTGTAQEYRDAWFAGYTPDLAAAVWVGYPEASIEMKTSCFSALCRPTRIQVSGGTWPTQIWGSFMGRALLGTPVSQFEIPSGLVAVTVDSRQSDCLASSSTPEEYRATMYFKSGTEPTSYCAPLPGDITEPDDDKKKPDDKPGNGGGGGNGNGNGNGNDDD
jgi:penicillin-binding protein 1A